MKQAQTEATNEGPTITTFKLVKALVYRNEFSTVPTLVYDYELPILRAMHGGEDAVRIESMEDIDVEDFNVSDEFARLQRKYKMKDNGKTIDYAAVVYGQDAAMLAQRIGVQYAIGNAKAVQHSLQINRRKGRRVVKKAA